MEGKFIDYKTFYVERDNQSFDLSHNFQLETQKNYKAYLFRRKI